MSHHDISIYSMNNITNIYDIDGNIIRKAGDNHKFTIEEIEKLVDELTEKVRQNPDNQVYKVYLNNANKWLFNMYNSMSKEDMIKRLSSISESIKLAKDNANEVEQNNLKELNKIVDDFKEQYESAEEVKQEDDERSKENIHTLHSGEPKTDQK